MVRQSQKETKKNDDTKNRETNKQTASVWVIQKPAVQVREEDNEVSENSTTQSKRGCHCNAQFHSQF